jgi:hypothetical protein
MAIVGICQAFASDKRPLIKSHVIQIAKGLYRISLG